MFFRYLCNYLPLGDGEALHLNKLESPSSTQECLMPIKLKSAQWFLRRRFYKFIKCIFSITYRGPSFEQTLIPFTQECFAPSSVEIGPMVLEKTKVWKVYDNAGANNNEDDNDDGQRTNFDQKSSLSLRLRWAKQFSLKRSLNLIWNKGLYRIVVNCCTKLHLLIG